MKSKEFHYTNKEMVADLIAITPISRDSEVLDAGSGKNKVWYKELMKRFDADECEIDDGCDFYKVDRKYDWIIGNPPYYESWKFTEQALKIANTGIAWLLNNQALNSHFTPARLQRMKKDGWRIRRIHVVADCRWLGRYYYVILERLGGKCEISWNTKSY